jgi:peptidyl-prolyl cis-trans isomerase SurA
MIRSRLGARLAGALAFALAALISSARPAHAVVVEKVVAVVGDEAIFLSDLKARSVPFVKQIIGKYGVGPQQAAAESELNRELLTKMVEELLVDGAAKRSNISATTTEIDNAIKTLAAQQQLTVAELYRVTREKSGLTDQDYRDEIRRQLLEGKMLNVRLRGRVRITEEDVKNAFERAKREDRERREYRIAWIVLRILPGSTAEEIRAREMLAKGTYERARSGEDFAELAAKLSDDAQTRDKGGDVGIFSPSKTPAAQAGKRRALSAEIENKILPLEQDEVAEPIRVGDAILIIKLLSRQKSRFTTLEAARPEIMQRMQNEIFVKERGLWIEELKKRTHVDPRL